MGERILVKVSEGDGGQREDNEDLEIFDSGKKPITKS